MNNNKKKPNSLFAQVQAAHVKLDEMMTVLNAIAMGKKCNCEINEEYGCRDWECPVHGHIVIPKKPERFADTTEA